MNVGRHDQVDRHAEQRAIGECDDERPPYAKHLQQAEDPRCIARQNVSNFPQGKRLVYVINKTVSVSPCYHP